MKRILLLTTGGTIASRLKGEGLEPDPDLSLIPEALRELYDVTVKSILNLDSSNIQPEEWQLVARSVYEARESFDGIVISHGTDTMAYTSSILTFMLLGIKIPVVLTGAQLP